MSPPSGSLSILTGRYAVCRLGPGEPWPAWACANVVSMTRTADELSVVCAEEAAPAGVRAEHGWRCLKLQGPIPFSAVGILAALLRPLADAGVGVFALSTFDTDYVLVKEADLAAARTALTVAGYVVESS